MSLSDEDRKAGRVEWKQGDPPHPLYVATAGEDQRAAAAVTTLEGRQGDHPVQSAAHPSETPRTDALVFVVSSATPLDDAFNLWLEAKLLARTLEREAAALRRELQQLSHERDGMLEKLVAVTAERDALQSRLDAPAEEVESMVEWNGSMQTVPADYARDLHRRLTEAQERLIARNQDWFAEKTRAESAEQRARDAEKDAGRLDWLEQHPWYDEAECFALVEAWRTRDGKRHPEGLRAAIDAARAAEGGKE